MEWTIPGTVLTGPREDVERSIRQIEGMFLGGGMIRSQLASVSGVEAHDIQNWVKRGFLPSPVNKRYSIHQFSRIVTINMLRTAMPMERICSLLTYINGKLDDESDDLIDDTVLYFMFLRLAARARHIGGDKAWDEALLDATASYQEPVPGARDRVIRVLRIMLNAWIASRFLSQVQEMVDQL